MSGKPTFFVQTFERSKGKLLPTDKTVAPTDSAALKRAEAVARRHAGAVALCILADEDTGAVRTATILGTFGEAPEDFAEGLLDG